MLSRRIAVIPTYSVVVHRRRRFGHPVFLCIVFEGGFFQIICLSHWDRDSAPKILSEKNHLEIETDKCTVTKVTAA